MSNADKLDALALLEAAATPGPWTETGRDVDHDRFVAEGKNPGDACGLGCEIDGPPEAWLRGQFHLHADAALIAAVRNVLPELLAVVRAADLLMRMHSQLGEQFESHDEIELRAALANLEAKL